MKLAQWNTITADGVCAKGVQVQAFWFNVVPTFLVFAQFYK
jgi:hypothetical protein